MLNLRTTKNCIFKCEKVLPQKRSDSPLDVSSKKRADLKTVFLTNSLSKLATLSEPKTEADAFPFSAQVGSVVLKSCEEECQTQNALQCKEERADDAPPAFFVPEAVDGNRKKKMMTLVERLLTVEKFSPPPHTAWVVDRHNDVLGPIFAAVRDRKLPRAGCTLLHFDSHPDMACITHETPPALVRGLHRGTYDAAAVHAKTNIASWILPLVLAGHLTQVVWVSGWFCEQMEVGTYDLLIGVDAAGKMKVSTGGGTAEGCSQYWQGADSWTNPTRLKQCRPWRLHVVRVDEEGNIPTAQRDEIVRLCSSTPWLLDFDDDFVSTSNPFADEFESLFGAAHTQLLSEVYEPVSNAAGHWSKLRQVVTRRLFLRPLPEYLESPAVQWLTDEGCERQPLVDFREFCRQLAKGPISVAYPPQLLQNAGETCGLPHHVSTADDMQRLLGSVSSLLGAIASAPRMVTVATSRADRYLPECHASVVHDLVIQLLAETVKVKNVMRMDLHWSV